MKENSSPAPPSADIIDPSSSLFAADIIDHIASCNANILIQSSLRLCWVPIRGPERLARLGILPTNAVGNLVETGTTRSFARVLSYALE